MSRPKGYARWEPRPETLAVVRDVKAVLQEYSAHLPLTVRQIFYRLVGNYGYDKTERAYSRLAEYLVRARRAEMIPFSAIRDDGTVAEGGGGWSSMDSFWRSMRYTAEGYERNHLEGQPVSIELWCEAAGMVPQLVRAVRDYDVPVYSTGGFSSVTVTYEIAQRALREGRPTIFLHVGDFDPSGESIFESMSHDAWSFLHGEPGRDENTDLIPERVALTADQVNEYDLPTAPPKSSDTRSANWYGETCQCEALPPDLLAEIVREAVEAHIDQEILEEVVAHETEERELILAHLDEFDGSR